MHSIARQKLRKLRALRCTCSTADGTLKIHSRIHSHHWHVSCGQMNDVTTVAYKFAWVWYECPMSFLLCSFVWLVTCNLKQYILQLENSLKTHTSTEAKLSLGDSFSRGETYLLFDLAPRSSRMAHTRSWSIVCCSKFGRICYRSCATVDFLPKWPR